MWNLHFIIRFQQKVSGLKGQFVDLKGVSSLCPDQELDLRWICSFPIYALVCILKQFQLILSVSFLAFFWMKLIWEMWSGCSFRCKFSFSQAKLELAQSLKSKPHHYWNEYSVDIKSLLPTIWLYRSTLTRLNYFLAGCIPHETVLNEQFLHYWKSYPDNPVVSYYKQIPEQCILAKI